MRKPKQLFCDTYVELGNTRGVVGDTIYCTEAGTMYTYILGGTRYGVDGINVVQVFDSQDAWKSIVGLNVTSTQEAAQNAALDTTMVTLTLTDSAVAPDFSAGNFFTLTLEGTDTLSNPTNITTNKMGSIVIRQPEAGAKTLAFGTYYKFTGGVDPTISVAASAVDVLYFHVISSTEIVCNVVQGLA